MGFKSAMIEITKRCNHRCTFCFNPAFDSCKTASCEQIDLVVSKLSSYGMEYVAVSGGEPLMEREKTKYLIKKLSEANIEICFNTNLTMMDDSFASFFEEYVGHDSLIYSSIPSVDEQTCDAITKSPESYQRILRGMDICRAHNIPIGLNMSVSEENAKDLGKVIEFLERHPVESFTLFPVIPPVYDRDNDIHKINCDNLRKVADTLAKIRERLGITVGSVRPLPLCIIGEHKKHHEIRGSRCTTGCERFSINMMDGSVEACSQHKKIYGNIFTDEIDELYERMEEWRSDRFLCQKCAHCPILDECGGACIWSDPCGRC